MAAAHDNADITSSLLHNHVNPNLIYDSESALHIAAQYGNGQV